MIIGWLLIAIGVIFAIFGIGGTATVRTGGRGGFAFTLTGAAGIVLIVLGAIFVEVPAP